MAPADKIKYIEALHFVAYGYASAAVYALARVPDYRGAARIERLFLDDLFKTDVPDSGVRRDLLQFAA